MDNILEYYLAGGKMRIGKKELTLELLRKDSVLRILLGIHSGDLSSLLAKFNLVNQHDNMVFDFNGHKRIKIGDDPTSLLNELKKRYSHNISGTLYFQLVYTTHYITRELEADLDERIIALKLKSAGGDL